MSPVLRLSDLHACRHFAASLRAEEGDLVVVIGESLVVLCCSRSLVGRMEKTANR